ncbi:MAG: peptidoglycan editing factor PgeF [Alphaproteobacteria bacterium]
MITLPVLGDLPRLHHAFFTREGGFSTGLYASLNCGLGSRDEPETVVRNRARAMEKLDRPAGALTTVRQEHTARVVTVEAPFPRDQAPVADAMVTSRPGIVLGILTADCAPVLLADGDAGVIGAAHAGWRGAIGGVIDATLTAMVALGARTERIVAAIGPCIAQTSYEVGPEFPAPFLAETPANAAFFLPSPRAGHFQFDLPSYLVERLTRLGVEAVARANRDTAREETHFFSYRRATLRGEPDYGRGLSAITRES